MAEELVEMESIRTKRPVWMVILFLAFLVVWLVWGIWQSVAAHNIGWKWDTTNNPVVTNYNTSYGSQISSANADFNSNTDLTVYSCGTPCNYTIQHINDYVSDADWAAAADSFHQGELCIPGTGNCNETTKKVTSGAVVWNTANGPYTDSYANYIARHEMGHIFGLAHAPCHAGGNYGGGSYYSVMAISCPYDARDELEDHDIDDINDKY